MKLYHNGTIITMTDKGYTQAVLADNGRIVRTGSYEKLKKQTPKDAVDIDLEGAFMLPAFIDSHSHILGYAYSLLYPDLSACKTVSDVERAVAPHISGGAFMTAVNLDESITIPHGFLGDIPALFVRRSQHSGVFNTAAERIFSLPQKSGGEFFDGEFLHLRALTPSPSIWEIGDAFKRAQSRYFSHGITVAQEGLITRGIVPVYRELINSNLIDIDICAYADAREPELFGAFSDIVNPHFHMFGYKLIADGSPQDKTAYVTYPYDDGSFGMPSVSAEDIEAAVKLAARTHRQLLIHANGDAACDMFIKAFEKYGCPDTRPVIIHGQLLRDDQLEALKKLGVRVSFFPQHIEHYGEAYIKCFGEAHARRICPAGSAAAAGLTFTLHQDSPVFEPNLLEAVQASAFRRTRSGRILGEEERISVYDAVKAITVNAAAQYFMEGARGVIKRGAAEDFIICSENPLETSLSDIRDIKISVVIKDGRIVYGGR